MLLKIKCKIASLLWYSRRKDLKPCEETLNKHKLRDILENNWPVLKNDSIMKTTKNVEELIQINETKETWVWDFFIFKNIV